MFVQFNTDWNIYILEFFQLTSAHEHHCSFHIDFISIALLLQKKKKKTRYDISEFWKVTSIMAIYHKILLRV